MKGCVYTIFYHHKGHPIRRFLASFLIFLLLSSSFAPLLYALILPAAPFDGIAVFPTTRTAYLSAEPPTPHDMLQGADRYFNDYQLTLTAGTAYEFKLTDTDFDALLILCDAAGTEQSRVCK